ncbi:protein transporter Sec61 subunit gamma [Cystobasidium minutum MCA 4210]|uniref:protein transporter Sec61 subunit gamma n=1 Tax=Cystobasidium minutum MCA 4210 TaxID=1397322 RepID=UPI0034CE1CF9|eukprot:jgi/Rhomi1/209513/estExt_Genemark1.C_3_t10124
MDSVKELVETPQRFVKEGNQFLARCTKPDKKEYLAICQAVAIGFAVMGFLGYFVKLIHIPVVQVIL